MGKDCNLRIKNELKHLAKEEKKKKQVKEGTKVLWFQFNTEANCGKSGEWKKKFIKGFRTRVNFCDEINFKI